MRVLIAGGRGGVRFYLARRLAEESHEVTIVDSDPARARFAGGEDPAHRDEGPPGRPLSELDRDSGNLAFSVAAVVRGGDTEIRGGSTAIDPRDKIFVFGPRRRPLASYHWRTTIPSSSGG